MFVVSFLTASLILSSVIGEGVNTIVKSARNQFPSGQLVVKPKSIDVSIMNVQVGDITDATMKDIEKLPGVNSTVGQMAVKLPLKADISLFGQQAVSDIVLLGIEKSIIATELNSDEFNYDPSTSTPLPVILPALFLDLFNLAYADSMGIPKMNDKLVVGKKFTLHCGQSFVFGNATDESKSIQPIICKIVGVTRKPGLVSGGYIPLEAAKYLNRLAGKPINRFTQVFVEGQPNSVVEIEKTIRKMGLIVEGNAQILGKISLASHLVLGVIVLYVTIVSVIAVICLGNLYSTLYISRKTEMGLMLCVGASRSLILGLAVGEIILTTLFASGIAGVLIYFSLLKADDILLNIMPQINLIPDHLILPNIWRCFSVLLIVVLICLTTSLPVLIKTITAKPVKLLH